MNSQFPTHLSFISLLVSENISEILSYFPGTIMTISKDRVKPSPVPDSWKLSEIFATGIVLGSYLAVTTVIFFSIIYDTKFFPVIVSYLNYVLLRSVLLLA